MLTLETITSTPTTFTRDAIQATKALARSKPWMGTFDERFEKLSTWVGAMCKSLGIDPIQLTHVGSKRGISGASKWRSDLRRIQLTGRLSVVTVFQLFAVATIEDALRSATSAEEYNDALRGPIVWSINLFRKCFPISFSRCVFIDGLLINKTRRDDD